MNPQPKKWAQSISRKTRPYKLILKTIGLDKFRAHRTFQGSPGFFNYLKRCENCYCVYGQLHTTGQLVGSNEIHAHRAVLASASPYLFELFSSDEDKKGSENVVTYRLNGG
ncbi:unnamed protein product [Callosobruchus maculatus]|uniref:BTB domain-containing protein n=1 Tax=Callosobruchus maculatus TaxID=64391 RepID=A0A653DHX7_CALMS|nr:unnamed protein product [Callosobruchus maculatus]